MLPPKPTKPQMIHSGVYVSEDTLARVEAIAKTEKVKSRNKLIGSFLTFAVDLFPLLKPLHAQVEEFAEKESTRTGERITYAQAVALLVERGLRSKK